MSLHDDAAALARQIRATRKQAEEEAKQQQRATISADEGACKEAVTAWMTEIGMSPLPEITVRHLGNDPFFYSDDDNPPERDRIVSATWVFDSHRYKAKYRTGRGGSMFPMDIQITARGRNKQLEAQWREIRGSIPQVWSTGLDKAKIGEALLEEKEEAYRHEYD